MLKKLDILAREGIRTTLDLLARVELRLDESRTLIERCELDYGNDPEWDELLKTSREKHNSLKAQYNELKNLL